jgi:phosphate transport system substrate-binding protein
MARLTAPTIAALVLGMSMTACSAGNETATNTNSAAAAGKKLSGTLSGAGSSAQEAAMGAWAAGFQKANPNTTINYDPVGSGGGVEQFLAGGVPFAASDAFLTDEELASSKKPCAGQQAFDVPSYVSPIAVIYNLPGVDKLQLSPETLANIMSGKITKWNDPAIKKDNPGAKLPAQNITPVHRSDESGTSANFTDYLHQAAGSAWPNEAAETWPYKSGEGASGTSGVVAAVKSGKGTIGYADQSQAGGLSVASVKVGSEFVAPSSESAAKVVDVSPRVQGRPQGDMAIQVDRKTTESGAYPIVLVSYVIACPSYSNKNTADLTKSFLSWVVSPEGQQAAAQTAGSAPLSSSLSSEGKTQVATISAG